MIAAGRPRLQRPAGLPLLATVFVAALAEIAVGWSVAASHTELGLYVGAAVALGLCFIFWRQAVYAVFLITFVEGFFRNLLDRPSLLLVKDVVLALIYVRVFGGRLARGLPLIPHSPINRPLAVFSAIVLLQTLNPNVSSMAQGLVGLRAWLYYVPLYYVGLEMLQSERSRRRFMWFFLGCAVTICALAVLQYLRGPEAYAAMGQAFARSTFFTSGVRGEATIFRPNATFSWPTHFALFLAAALFLNIALLLTSQGRARVLQWLVLTVLTCTTLIQGQRSLFVLLPPLVLMVLRLRSRLRVGARLSAVSVLGIVLIDRVAGLGAFDRVIGLLQNEDGVLAVRVLTYWEHFQAGLQSSVIGLGTGATAVGSRYVAGEASGEVADIPLFVEVALAKVVADFSVIGLGVYLWLFARLVAASVKTHNRAVAVGAEETASFAAVMMAYQLLVLYFGYELAAAAIPLWFLSARW